MDQQQEEGQAVGVPSLDALKGLLAAHGVDISGWGRGEAKQVEHLWAELAVGEAQLQAEPLRRVLPGVVQVIIRRGDRILIEAEQVMQDGRRRARNIPPAEKMLPGESSVEAAIRCLQEEFAVGREDIEIVEAGAATRQDERMSQSYPGLLSRYTFHQVEARVRGLPRTGFWTTERADGTEGAVRQHRWEWQAQGSSAN